MQAAPAKAAILMLTTAHELYKRSPQPASRLMYHIGALMAREHLACEDAESAHKLLESVAGAFQAFCSYSTHLNPYHTWIFLVFVL